MVETIWHEFLKIVNEEVGTRIVETWFKAVALSRWDSAAKIVYLDAPNAFVKDWVTTNYNSLMQLHLGRLLNEDKIKVRFLDDTKPDISIIPAVSLNSPNKVISNSTMPAVVQKKRATLTKTPQISKLNINPNYQFESFVVGPNNSLAYAAAKAVAEKPGLLYNPLFIYGDSGLGKTHLLHAIGNSICSQNNKVRIVYQSADRFVADFINAIRFDKISFFEDKYKNLDVLLVDDIQFISNKEQTQEAFFHIFNSLYENRKQIVFSSDSLPKDIAGLASRLRSRLDGGLITDIMAPTLETKIAILKKKADLHKEILSDDVANFIASYQTCNVRELEGMLIRVIAYSSINSEPITLELVQRILNCPVKAEEKQGVIDLNHVAQIVSQYYKFSILELRSSKRNKCISLARHVAMYFMKKMTESSLNEIGAFWCRKDHSTVIHALEKIDQVRKLDKLFNQELEHVEKLIIGQ